MILRILSCFEKTSYIFFFWYFLKILTSSVSDVPKPKFYLWWLSLVSFKIISKRLYFCKNFGIFENVVEIVEKFGKNFVNFWHIIEQFRRNFKKILRNYRKNVYDEVLRIIKKNFEVKLGKILRKYFGSCGKFGEKCVNF